MGYVEINVVFFCFFCLFFWSVVSKFNKHYFLFTEKSRFCKRCVIKSAQYLIITGI